MTELERLDKVLEMLYPKKYRTVSQEITTGTSGIQQTLYSSYVEGFPYGTGYTPEDAIFVMIKNRKDEL